jgi:hypothetical protein
VRDRTTALAGIGTITRHGDVVTQEYQRSQSHCRHPRE